MAQWLPTSITANPEDVLIGILLENETNGLSAPIANGGIGNLLVPLDPSNPFDNYYITNSTKVLSVKQDTDKDYRVKVSAIDTDDIEINLNNSLVTGSIDCSALIGMSKLTEDIDTLSGKDYPIFELTREDINTLLNEASQNILPF